MKKMMWMAAAVAIAGCSGMKPDPELAKDETHTLVTANLLGDGYAQTDYPAPKASDWQTANRRKVDSLTREGTLDRYLSCAANADALCACVKPGYSGDPAKLTQIQAISDLVLKRGYVARRRLCVGALERAKAKSRTNDVDTFFRQQLELCGYRNVEPFGSWALYLPFDSMNAGHLILSKDADGKLSAVLLWRWGSPFRVEEARLTDEGFELRFGNHKPKDLPDEKNNWRKDVVLARVDGDLAQCAYYQEDGNGRPATAKKGFVAKRNPPVGPAPDLADARFGKPIDLLGKGVTIADFELMEKDKRSGWTLKDGVLSNRIARDASGNSKHVNGNLRTRRADFMDFRLEYDVRVMPKCNSGVYLRGIYEIQVLDSYGQPADCHNMAAFYGRITPSATVEKPAKEWQHVEVTLWRRHVTVKLNGVTIIDNRPVEGITGGAMTPNEFVPGPLYIQGDHSDADFRNFILTPILN